MIIDKLKTYLPPKKATSDNILVGLDIGTEYVKALVARVEGQDIKILGVGRKHQDLDDMHNGAIEDI